MNWDTLERVIGVVLFVVFLVVMLRCCGGMMSGSRGGSGMARPHSPDERQKKNRDAPQRREESPDGAM